MDEPKIKFGDKIFIYGQFMDLEKWYEWGLDNPSYNSAVGYLPNGGYFITPKKSRVVGACLPGFLMDFLSGPSLASPAPFSGEKGITFVDVTKSLALRAPITQGTKVWMPIQERMLYSV